MTTTGYEKLKVYQLSEELADRVWEVVCEWDYFAKSTIGAQLVKAADSIGSNIAEGTGRGSYADNKRFAKISRGSLFETKNWLKRARKRQLLSYEDADELESIVSELLPRLSAYINSIGRN